MHGGVPEGSRRLYRLHRGISGCQHPRRLSRRSPIEPSRRPSLWWSKLTGYWSAKTPPPVRLSESRSASQREASGPATPLDTTRLRPPARGRQPYCIHQPDGQEGIDSSPSQRHPPGPRQKDLQGLAGAPARRLTRFSALPGLIRSRGVVTDTGMETPKNARTNAWIHLATATTSTTVAVQRGSGTGS